jgi:uncharacterized protein YndB with AHSA1/START domain
MEYAVSTSVSRVYDAPLEVVYEKFYDVVWKDGGGLGPKFLTKIVQPGNAETHEGEVRSVPLNLMHERILRTEKDKFVEYTVEQESMATPFAAHLGRVDFSVEEGGKTKVVWSVRYTPKPLMSLMCKPMVEGSFSFMLMTLGRVLNRQSKTA